MGIFGPCQSAVYCVRSRVSVPPPPPSDDASGRVRSLRDPSRKMSKSDSDPRSCVYLTDSPEAITDKLKKALTDFTSEVYYQPESRPAVSSLMELHALSADITLEEVHQAARGLTTAQYKLFLADVIVDRLRPVRERWERLAADPGYLRTVLERGREQAAAEAEQTWKAVVDAVQLRIA